MHISSLQWLIFDIIHSHLHGSANTYTCPGRHNRAHAHIQPRDSGVYVTSAICKGHGGELSEVGVIE